MDFPKLPRASLRWLNRDVAEFEIKAAMFQLGPNKVPSPDGLPASFFKKHWTWVREDLVLFVKEVFRTRVVLEDMNHSFICLIPKQAHPEHISQFHPICLSNMIIKLITKVIAIRMKPLMSELTGPNQASFIPGRHTTDNILMVQEVVHSLRKKRGKKGALIAKIDLEKAYDRVE